jgi:RNA recognition motif-containing protein
MLRDKGWEAERMRAQYFRGNLFVANLPPELTEDQLAEAFDPFGIVLSAFIARDPETGKRLRYGFIDIATEKAAKLAVEAMNGVDLAGHKLDVRISDRKQAKKPASARPAARRSPPRTPARRVSAEPRPLPADDAEEGFGLRPYLGRRPYGDDAGSAEPRPLPADADAARPFVPRPAARRQPTFLVERRPLPRRV